MQHTVTLSISENVANSAEAEARRTSQSVEEVLVSWLNRGGDTDLEAMPDNELLVVCDSMMAVEQQEELSEILDRNREGGLDASSRERMKELMTQYQQGLLRKARALKIAVERGLAAGLNYSLRGQ
ncbi:MAG: hypothetical protein O3A00_28875 [Planctomycetota bacterium]|nr:hypothetical protein [Planctomycetota bacterium]